MASHAVLITLAVLAALVGLLAFLPPALANGDEHGHQPAEDDLLRTAAAVTVALQVVECRVRRRLALTRQMFDAIVEELRPALDKHIGKRSSYPQCSRPVSEEKVAIHPAPCKVPWFP